MDHYQLANAAYSIAVALTEGDSVELRKKPPPRKAESRTPPKRSERAS
jgi:hypothetical protein